MPSDPVTDPGLTPTPPALTGHEDQDAHQRVGQDVRLPVPVAIVDENLATRPGLFLNQVWLRGNNVAIGVFGTAASWFLAFASLANQHPRIAIAILSLLTIVSEEKFSTQPVVTNLLRYGMESFDPSAADKIFAVKPVDPDPIGTAADKIIAESTKAFFESPDYRLLKDETDAEVRRQLRREVYLSAGMEDDVVALDAETARARAKREAKRAKAEALEQGTEDPVDTPEPPVVPSHHDGTGIPAPEASIDPVVAPDETSAGEDESTADPAPSPEQTLQGLVQEVQRDIDPLERKKDKRPRRKKEP